jgi:hypothetical protein
MLTKYTLYVVGYGTWGMYPDDSNNGRNAVSQSHGVVESKSSTIYIQSEKILMLPLTISPLHFKSHFLYHENKVNS